MVFKFKYAYHDMNKRENIIVMVDEAHPTQEGDLGRKIAKCIAQCFSLRTYRNSNLQGRQNTF